MPAVLRALAGAGNSIERWWRQLEEAQKHPDGSGKVVNVLAMAASYDPDPAQFFGIRLPVTFDTCEVIEERWANWLRQDPVVAIETQASNLRRLKAFYMDCGEKDQFNLLYGARRFVRRLNELGIAHRYEEFPDNHTVCARFALACEPVASRPCVRGSTRAIGSVGGHARAAMVRRRVQPRELVGRQVALAIAFTVARPVLTELAHVAMQQVQRTSTQENISC
jgi:hypothetical protein